MGGIYWLASYPKSGNTWLRAFLHNLRVDGDAPVDINELTTGAIASGRGWIDDVLGFDSDHLTPDEVDRLRPDVYRWSVHAEEVGYHKIHDAYTVLPDGEPLVSREGTLGAVYIVRNPLDVAPSTASHYGCTVDRAIAIMGFPELAVAARRDGIARQQVRQRLLSWSAHVASWIDAPGLRCEVVRYEDLAARPLETFTRAAAFLDLPTDRPRVEKAIRHSEFSELRRQEDERGFHERGSRSEPFFRRGRAGGWRDSLTPEQVERIIDDHGAVMRRIGYLDAGGNPVEQPA